VHEYEKFPEYSESSNGEESAEENFTKVDKIVEE